MLRFKLHRTRLPVKFFKNNINAGFKSIKIKKKFFNFLLIYTVNLHINKDLKNCTGSGISHTTHDHAFCAGVSASDQNASGWHFPQEICCNTDYSYNCSITGVCC